LRSTTHRQNGLLLSEVEEWPTLSSHRIETMRYLVGLIVRSNAIRVVLKVEGLHDHLLEESLVLRGDIGLVFIGVIARLHLGHDHLVVGLD